MLGRRPLHLLATLCLSGQVLSAQPSFAAEPTATPPTPTAATPSAAEEPAPPTEPTAEATSEEPAPAEEPPTEATPSEEPPPPVEEPVAEPVEPPPAEPLYVAPSEEPPVEPPSKAGLFAQGRLRVGGSIGFSTAIGGASNQSWFILGVGLGAFVLDGLEVHADSTFWIGDPFLATLTPGVRYVFWMVPTVKPYVGTFFRHYFVTGVLEDSNSLGGRAGINIMMSERAYVGGGVIYEHFLDDALFTNADQVYPEITIAVAF